MDSTISNDLWLTAFDGNLDKLKNILETQEHALDINYRNGTFKGSPFIVAGSKGHVGVMSVLLEYNCDPLARDKDGKTAVHHAIINNHNHVLQFLKENVDNFMDLLRIQCQTVKLKLKGNMTFQDISALKLAILTCQTDAVAQIFEYESYEENLIESATSFAKNYRALLTTEYGERVQSMFKVLGNALTGEHQEKDEDAKATNDGQIEADSTVEDQNSDTCLKEPFQSQNELNIEVNNVSLPEIDPTSEICREDTTILTITERLDVLGDKVQSDSSSAQQRLENLLEKVDQKVGQNKDGIDEMKQDIKSIIEIMKKNQTRAKEDTSDIKTKLESIMGNRSSSDCNDVVYNLIFYIISKHVSLEPRKWKKLYETLCELYPEIRENYRVEEIDEKYGEVSSKAHACLVIWKVVSATKDGLQKLGEIREIMDKMKMASVYKAQIQPILEEYTVGGTLNKCELGEKLLSRLADELGDEWYKLGIELDCQLPELDHLKQDYRTAHDRNVKLLVNWCNREGDKQNKHEILINALSKVKRNDLVLWLERRLFYRI